ncbi:MAG: rod shape-determining protein MreC, partial [Panacibacter sp.]
LNRRSKVNAMLKKGYYTGDLEWDGKDPSYLLLSSISKSAQVKIGDTVLTSNVSNQLSFPSGLMVGTVAEIIPNPESGFLSMKVKSSTNFYSLQYVYLTENIQWQEQKTLEDKTPKD